MTKAQEIGADSLLTSYQVGALLQVNPSSINKWVKEGRIPAFRTPGGHHRIRAADLVVFLKDHHMPIPTTLANAALRRLLVVDDDPKQLKAIERMFKPYESRVELKLVDNGIDALVQVGAFKPHAVILDVFMPNLDGIEVCRRFGGLEETKEIKVIIASAQLSSDVEERALAAGAAVCFQKPLDAERLLGVIGVGGRAFLNL